MARFPFTDRNADSRLKNSTPRQIATRAALAITAANGGVVLLLAGFMGANFVWWVLPLDLLGSFICSYLIVLSYLDRYIYRKIKLIYKTIHNQKVGAEAKRDLNVLDQPIIDDVEKEVQEWAAVKEREMNQYEDFAKYRRRYIGDISHELKTPIFNIQGYLHTILDDESVMDNQKFVRKFLRKAARNVERLQTIVEDLSAISRLESGELILDMEVFNIRDLAAEVLEELDLKSKDVGVQLGFKEGADAGFMVRADRESIRQVIINLVNNSLKYGNEQGHTKIGFYDMETYILCEVADNGIGIPEKHVPHVFDRFYRVDKSRSRQKGGSGLGLSIVKHIIEAHHQTINVRSSVGLGSTFGITLAKAE
ncbi:cell wall metabolism sensor histidine kinase WalK [Lewinella sp. 4G2]|uniref:sensor histidine kinase n=1 Tax=Lewinella sp. 4G2 TaxID=1803372 RepID=UPI0007B4D4E8|nr:ATP-binding protein [Lewinella sp. 4G2]OAV46167.1 two-component sensor histidine kinase [Lewinella sp. 4G2]